jgi:hypothetical protein
MEMNSKYRFYPLGASRARREFVRPPDPSAGTRRSGFPVSLRTSVAMPPESPFLVVSAELRYTVLQTYARAGIDLDDGERRRPRALKRFELKTEQFNASFGEGGNKCSATVKNTRTMGGPRQDYGPFVKS